MPPPDFQQYDERLGQAISDPALHRGLPEYLGVRTESIGPGRMRCEIDVHDELLNPFGSLHGGVIAALVDHVLGAVLYPVIPPGAWAATTEFKLNLLRPVRAGGVDASAEILSLSRRTAVVRIDVHNDGILAALAQGTVTVVPPSHEESA